MATVTVELPDGIVQGLEVTSGGISRCVLEAVALEGYRSERLSRGQVAQVLGLGWQETEQFLAEHGLCYQYTLKELDDDRHNLDRAASNSTEPKVMAETLSPEVESLIQRHLDGQQFLSPNDVLLAAMQIFEKYQFYQRMRSDLREGFDQIDRGDAIELEDDSALQTFFDDIKARGRQRLGARQAS